MCQTGNFQIVVTIEARVAATNAWVGSYQFNISSAQSSGSITQNLSQLGNFQPNTAYTFKLTAQLGKGDFFLFHVGYSSYTVNKAVGGLRIKEIRTHDAVASANNIVRTYEYKPEASSSSSGVLRYQPAYGYFISTSGQGYAFVFESGSVVPLKDYDGYHISYNTVIENHNGNGRKIYQFHVPQSISPISPPAAPPLFIANNGKMLQDKIQNSSQAAAGNSNSFVARTQYSYPNPVYLQAPGVVFKAAAISAGPTMLIGYTSYSPRTGYCLLSSKSETLDEVSTTTSYTYDPQRHLFPVSETMTNSEGATFSTHYQYAPDLPAGAIKDALTQRNILLPPIQTIQKQGAVNVAGVKTEYAFFNKTTGLWSSSASNADPYPWKYHNYEMTWNAAGSVVLGSADGWVLAGTVNDYHTNGYPKTFTQAGWQPETYQWENGLIKERKYLDFTWRYNYHPGTRLVSSIIDIDNQTVNFAYDKLMRLQTATARSGNVVTSYQYQYKDATNPRNLVRATTTFTAVSGSLLTQRETVQYFDGLGRQVQEVKRKYRPAKGQNDQAFAINDVAIHLEYDNQNRLIKTTLPYPSPFNTGAYYAPPAGTPFTLGQYESSPLNRQVSLTSPIGYATTTAYSFNIAPMGIPGTAISYNPYSLYETRVTDPDGRVSITYKDKRGRLVLQTQTNTANTSPAQTWYRYDGKDRPTMVIPPGANAGTTPELIFTYEYSPDNLVTRKKVPGAAAVELRYNSRDLLTFQRDGNLTAANQSIGYKYDLYGRVTESGIVSGFPANPDAAFNFSELLTRNWYDGFDGVNQLNLISFPQYRGKLRRTENKVLGSASTFLHSTLSYDIHGRLTAAAGNNYLNTSSATAENVSYTYDWADNRLSENRTHNPGTGAATGAHTVNFQWNYDHAGRSIGYFLNLNGQNTHLAEYNYDPRDQLIERNLHSGLYGSTWAWLQSVDYAYNDMGWLTAINTSSVSGTATPFSATCPPTMPNPGSTPLVKHPEANDLFYLELRYDQLFSTSSATGGAISNLPGTAQRAGNISQMVWRVRGRDRQAYSFQYDHLSRLSTATYYDVNSSNAANLSARYNESLSYDLRGNISTLQRNGHISANCSYGQVDNLSYAYTANTNRLASVTDNAPLSGRSHGFNPGAGGAGYTYDANGNLKSDSYKGITNIAYNHLNLPHLISFSTGNSIEIVYDAGGQKLRKIVKTGATIQYEHDYAGGLEYRKTGTGSKRVEAVYHAEGRYYNLNVDANNTVAWRREYALRDHLGNTRLMFADKNGNGIIEVTNNPATCEIIQENHYYPFGLNHEGPWLMNDAARDNLYQYNGKEWNVDFGLNWNDYGARWYMPDLGRWGGVDALAGKYPNISQYAFCLNNPVINVDPLGMDVYRYDDKTGGMILYKKTDDNFDQIGKFKMVKNKETGERSYELKTKRDGTTRTHIDNIEKGILSDGMNFKTNDNVINVGGEGQATVEGFESFITQFSDMINKEIAGFYYTPTGKNGISDISHIYVGNFQNNTEQKAFATPKFHSVRPDLVGKLDVHTSFHTHLSRFPESSKLVPSGLHLPGGDMAFKRSQIPNGIKRFIILTTGYPPIPY